MVTHLTNVADWLAWGAIIVTLISLAWSAKRYVDLREREDEHLRYRRFFEIMDMLGSPGSIASKVAAAYQLKRYSEYGGLLERFCRDAQTYVTVPSELRNLIGLPEGGLVEWFRTDDGQVAFRAKKEDSR